MLKERSTASYSRYFFGKLGSLASEEVIHCSFFKSKCIPILIFALNSSDLKSLNFTENNFFKKLFETSNFSIITKCQIMFNFVLPSFRIANRTHKLEASVGKVSCSYAYFIYLMVLSCSFIVFLSVFYHVLG